MNISSGAKSAASDGASAGASAGMGAGTTASAVAQIAQIANEENIVNNATALAQLDETGPKAAKTLTQS